MSARTATYTANSDREPSDAEIVAAYEEHALRNDKAPETEYCAQCGERWPCSDWRRTDIRPDLKVLHTVEPLPGKPYGGPGPKRYARAVLVGLLLISLPSFAVEPCRINVNTSNVSELELFARTGSVLAARIAVGQPYKTLEQLDAVKGIGQSWMAANGPHVAFAGATTCTEKVKAPKPISQKGGPK